MIELDSNKWLLVKIACENMAALVTERAMHASYEWLIDVSGHNARVASVAEDFDAKSQLLANREPSYPATES